MKRKIVSIFLLLGIIVTMNGQSYKMMTYNIRYDNPNDGENQWTKRKAYLCNQISFYSPDVFGIQEGLHHQVKYIDSTFSNYKYVGVGRDDAKEKGEYSAIFYNGEKFEVEQEGTFWLSETPNKISVGWDAAMERICTYVLLKDLTSKKRFWVFNAHFDHIGDEARIKSSALIIKKMEALNHNKYPVLLMGDFNLKPTSKPIRYLSNVLNDSKEHSISKSFGPVGTFNGFKFHEPVTDRIDYIFTSKSNIQIKKYAILSDSKDCKYPSDHLPVYIEVEFNNVQK